MYKPKQQITSFRKITGVKKNLSCLAKAQFSTENSEITTAIAFLRVSSIDHNKTYFRVNTLRIVLKVLHAPSYA